MMGTGTSLPASDAGTRYYTVAQAARELQVHRTTITRWINSGRLPASRVGPKAVRIKATDLQRVITPANAPAQRAGEVTEPAEGPPTARTIRTVPRPLKDEEIARALVVLDELRQFRGKLRAKYGDTPPEPSDEEVIGEMRDERSGWP